MGYPSDLSNAQFNEIKMFIPEPLRGGRKRSVNIKKVLDGIFYIVKSGCQWRMLPKDFPPWGTVYYYYRRWQREGVYSRIYSNLYKKIRVQANKESPYIGIMDSQSVKTTEKGGSKVMMAIRK